MKLIRTFHPIGQGAFYTERHFVNGNEFNIVYDCGSFSLKGIKLDRKIKSTFPENYKIDILFISHFHADHINGIDILRKHCKIETVVLPLLDIDAKTLLIASNYINESVTDIRIIDNPNEYFGNETTVISISEANIEEGGDGINMEAPIDISTLKQAGIVNSGNAFVSGLANHEWYFVPFNYRHISSKIKFIDALSALNLTLTDIDTIAKIQANKAKIKAAYNSVDGDLNQNSMLLFSGSNKEESISTFAPCQNFRFNYRLFNRVDRLNSGCIYFGDIDLKKQDIINNIQVKLANLLPYVGTIQVPHHGSIHNFDCSILHFSKLMCAIISYGCSNSYGHPSDRVIGDIFSHSVFPFLVTENQHSIVIQRK